MRKSYDVRNSLTFLRDGFFDAGKYEMPYIYKGDADLENLCLLGFHHAKTNDSMKNLDKTIHFYMDDHKFLRVWREPEKYVRRLAQYKQVITPDFSLYTNMPIPMQIYNVFRRRWCGAFWQSEEIKVIPSVGWGDARSYEFCFDGIEKNSVVSVSTLGAVKFKESYLQGYREMCQRIQPERVICYCKPFDEMKEISDVIYVPYESKVGGSQAISGGGA